jgi:hypothetical protein
MFYHQLLIGSVVIDLEFSREDHSLIPATAIGRELKPNHIKLVVKVKKINI